MFNISKPGKRKLAQISYRGMLWSVCWSTVSYFIVLRRVFIVICQQIDGWATLFIFTFAPSEAISFCQQGFGYLCETFPICQQGKMIQGW